MASAKILESKKAKVEQITELLKNATAGVIVDYKGITVEDDTKLRKELREAGVTYFVEKNSILRFAMRNVGLEGLTYTLEGTTAIALTSGDQTAPARILGAYADQPKEGKTFALKAGFVDGGVIDQAGVEALAATPSKEVLIAKMMGSLMSSLYGLAYVLQAKIDKENGGEEATEAPAEA